MKRDFITSIFVYIVAITAISLTLAGAAAALPAFPGAEGFGADTVGGRGGQVIEVTNLNASGPGSLRAAVEASGPRIVVFRVGGIIETDNITIRNPYITIAGQTAPGDGICLKRGGILIKTHDVIIRGMRVRVGADGLDGIEVAYKEAEPYNVIVDHCSVSWAVDENFSTWFATHDVTFQWNLIAEPLEHLEGGYGMLIGEHAQRVSVHHNLFISNHERMPTVKWQTSSEVINNLVYNWYWWATRSFGDISIIANHYVPGPNTGNGKAIDLQDRLDPISAYVKDNMSPRRPDNTGDDWLNVHNATATRLSSPPNPLSNVQIDPVEDVYDKVLNGAGAILPHRDPVDTRLVNDVKNGTGSLGVTTSSVGGWPTYASGTAPVDSDHDGMPDSWEISVGLNPNNASDRNGDLDGDGYTNVEEYINGLFGGSETGQAPPPAPQNLRIVSN